MAKDFKMQWNGCIDTFNHKHLQSSDHAGDRLPAVHTESDEFGDQRVVVAGHDPILIGGRIDSDTRPARGIVSCDFARRWPKGHGVFGIEATFQAMASGLYFFLSQSQSLSSGNLDLFFDNIDSRDHLSDGCSTWTRVFISMK